jgi:hypothetical protein
MDCAGRGHFLPVRCGRDSFGDTVSRLAADRSTRRSGVDDRREAAGGEDIALRVRIFVVVVYGVGGGALFNKSTAGLEHGCTEYCRGTSSDAANDQS